MDWKEFNRGWIGRDPFAEAFRWLLNRNWPISAKQMRSAARPPVIALGLGLIALWADGVVQALPNFFDLPLFGRVSTNAVSVAGGIALIAFAATLPFSIPETDGLTLPKRFELAAILSGAVVALAGAVFLMGEYQDQKQARITRAWDLFHKATDRARKRSAVAEDLLFREGELTPRAIENEHALLKAAIQCKLPSLRPFDPADPDLDALAKRVRSCAARGNDGQLGALETLNEARVDLEGIRLQEIDLERIELPNASLESADFTSAILSRSNLAGADIGDAKLNNAIANSANLRSSYAYGAEFNGAYLFQADLAFANLVLQLDLF